MENFPPNSTQVPLKAMDENGGGLGLASVIQTIALGAIYTCSDTPEKPNELDSTAPSRFSRNSKSSL